MFRQKPNTKGWIKNEKTEKKFCDNRRFIPLVYFMDNGKEEGEPSVEIEERMAVQFIHRQVDKDAWLEEHYPKQMEIYHNAIEQTKEQILQQYNI